MVKFAGPPGLEPGITPLTAGRITIMLQANKLKILRLGGYC